MLHPGSAVHVRHAFFAKFSISGVALIWVYNIVWHILHVPGILDTATVPVEGVSLVLIVVLVVPASFAISVMVLRMARKKKRLSERVEQFRFAEAKWFCEDDHGIVQRNIIASMKRRDHADTQGTDADIISEFEAMVQSEVPKLFAASLGRVGVPRHFGLCASLPLRVQSIDYACAQFRGGSSARHICFQLGSFLTLVIAGMPLCVALGVRTAECVYSPARSRYMVNAFLLAALMILFLGGSCFLLRVLVELASQGSDVAAAAFPAAVALHGASTLFIYMLIIYRVHHRRLKRPES